MYQHNFPFCSSIRTLRALYILAFVGQVKEKASLDCGSLVQDMMQEKCLSNLMSMPCSLLRIDMEAVREPLNQEVSSLVASNLLAVGHLRKVAVLFTSNLSRNNRGLLPATYRTPQYSSAILVVQGSSANCMDRKVLAVPSQSPLFHSMLTHVRHKSQQQELLSPDNALLLVVLD